MPNPHPPTLDPLAVARWQRRAPARSPWLHEEVARRMAARLEWIRLQPQVWLHWEPVRGGLAAQPLVEQRYPQARCIAAESDPRLAAAARQALGRPWWRVGGPQRTVVAKFEPASVQMVWANMALHFSLDPQALMAGWHAALQPQGFLMFSCFGPDTVRELRELYARLGWPAAGPEFTDMHDWGDMLVAAGFAEPVMDMERITLAWDSPQKLLAELRELGANLHPSRFAALRGRHWRERLERELASSLRDADGRLALTFEVVYGHAIKPPPRLRMQGEAALGVEELRGMLRAGRKPTR